MILIIGDGGTTTLLVLLCCVNAGREKCSCTPTNKRNFGEENTSSSVCLPLCSALSGSNVKGSGDFASYCIAGVILCIRACTSGQRSGHGEKLKCRNVRGNDPAGRLQSTSSFCGPRYADKSAGRVGSLKFEAALTPPRFCLVRAALFDKNIPNDMPNP